MTTSKIATEGGNAKNSELPELKRPQHDPEMEEDDEGFQTVVSKRTVKLMQLQQQQQNRQQHRRGYNNGYGHHGYGNGNGRHYHRQYGPPHSNSSGTNSNSSASSIPEELPKDKDIELQHEQNQILEQKQQPTVSSISTTPSPPVMAWARIAAGEKPPKIDVTRQGGADTLNSPVSTFDVKPLAISLVASDSDGAENDIPVKTISGLTNSLPQKSDEQAQQQGQSPTTTSTPTSQKPQPQPVVLPPPPSIWKIRAAALSSGQTKSNVAQGTGPNNSASSVVAGTNKGNVPPPIEIWPSLEDAGKPAHRATEVNIVSFTSQTGGTTPSESATDSGNEEILRITGPPELNDEKWPLPLLSNGIGKGVGSGNDGSAVVSERQSRHGSGDAMSSSGCDGGGNGETGDGEQDGDFGTNETKKKKKNKKASKPKWVPLILEDEPPKQPSKPKKRKEKFEPRGNMSQHNGTTGGDASSECATPTEGLPRSSTSRVGTSGRGGRNGHKGKHRNTGYYKFYKETSDPSSQVPDMNGTSEEWNGDYTPEFTTINPVFPPLTEFVMPYTTFAPYSPPPDAQAYTYAPIPIDDAVLTQLIQKQIEYYFSEENLCRDFYLRRKMDSEGYIPISLITSFYRIQSMTQDYKVVLNAIKASELIDVKEEADTCAWARPVENPTKWPIVDTAASSIPPPPAIVKSFLKTVTTAPTTTTQ